jgi:hypothetical protein
MWGWEGQLIPGVVSPSGHFVPTLNELPDFLTDPMLTVLAGSALPQANEIEIHNAP